MLTSGSLVEKAEMILQAHGNGHFPIDPFAIASRMGAVIEECSPESGALVIEPNRVVIKTNPYELPARRRFTAAHEIGHWVLGHGSSFRDNPDDTGSSSGYLEREANSFAANLLMPRNAVLAKALQEKLSVDEMARWFDVSKPAMQWRLRNLDLIQ